jgi:hypothetical protein
MSLGGLFAEKPGISDEQPIKSQSHAYVSLPWGRSRTDRTGF